MKRLLLTKLLILSSLTILINCSKDEDSNSQPSLSITSFSPKTGTEGTLVTITGTNFSNTNSKNLVKFGNTTATVTKASNTSLTTTVPKGATTAKISVTVDNKTVSSLDNFIVEDVINLELNKTSLALNTSDSEQLILSGAGENEVIWSSDNIDIAIVDENGVVKAVGEGTTFVSASSGNSEISAEVTVEPSVFVTVNLFKNTNYTAGIWKNGIIEELSDGTKNSYVSSIDISTGDVYASGSEIDPESDNYIGRLFKNGNVTDLTDKTISTIITTVKVLNSDTYLAGYYYNGSNYVATIWKNGVSQDLSDGTTNNYVSSMFIDNDNVYVSGYERIGNKTVAKIWVNGVPTILTDGLNNARATSILSIGEDIFVAGHDDLIATVWKNGTPTILGNEANVTFANTVFVDGEDVYVGGEELDSGHYIAKVWKNGVPINLTDGTNRGSINSVYVYQGDVYAVGFENTTIDTEEINVAKLWINGEPTILAGESYSSYATSVIVK